MMQIKDRKTTLAILAVVMTLLVSTGLTLAYFSDFTRAEGSAVLHLSGQTVITEVPGDNSKEIQITNMSEEPVDMITRVKVVGPGEFTYTFTPANENDWTKGSDGWWYYERVLPKNGSTSKLTVEWDIPADTAIENYDVAVLHESLAARYDADGNLVTPTDKGWEGPAGSN